MTVEATGTVAAGWYTDPAGSGQLRWWNGMSWTENLQPPPPPLPVPQPEQNPAQSGLPVWDTDLVNRPAQYRAMGASQGSPVATAARSPHISNRAAWWSLGTGILAITLVVGHLAENQGGYIVTTSSITSIVWGVRALLHRKNGRSTNLWAPIVGMLLGVTAAILSVAMLTGYLSASPATTSVAPGSQVAAGTTTSDIVPYLSPTPRVFANNPALTSLETTTGQMAQKIQDRYAKGSGVSTDASTWPTTVTESASGVVSLPDGEVLGSVPVDDHLVYRATANGFNLGFSNSTTREVFLYSSDSTNHFAAACLATDESCK